MNVRFRVLLALYSAGVELGVWLGVLPVMLIRRAMGRVTARELSEWLWGAVLPRGERVLVHAVSAGEMTAAEPLIGRFARRSVLLSTHTRAGRKSAEMLRQRHQNVEACVCLPWDRFAIRRWLRRTGVTAVVVLETEFWPNLFAACRSLDIPLFVANGRMSEREARRYRLASWFFGDVFRCATSIGVQNRQVLDRFASIGVPEALMHVGGNLKLDAGRVGRALPPNLARALRAERLVVAGSTHHPEERLLLECLTVVRRACPVRLVLAPRDTGRVAQVARIARTLGLMPVPLSEALTARDALAPWDVMIVDDYGWLTGCYECADVAFVGGTIAPVGGHNVIEAVSLGCPVVVGPHAQDIADIVHALAQESGIVLLRGEVSAESIAATFEQLLADPVEAAHIGSAGRDVCLKSAGAADRYWAAMAQT